MKHLLNLHSLLVFGINALLVFFILYETSIADAGCKSVVVTVFYYCLLTLTNLLIGIVLAILKKPAAKIYGAAFVALLLFLVPAAIISSNL